MYGTTIVDSRQNYLICTRAVERSFAWLSRYRRLNTIFEGRSKKDHIVAFVAIAFHLDPRSAPEAASSAEDFSA